MKPIHTLAQKYSEIENSIKIDFEKHTVDNIFKRTKTVKLLNQLWEYLVTLHQGGLIEIVNTLTQVECSH